MLAAAIGLAACGGDDAGQQGGDDRGGDARSPAPEVPTGGEDVVIQFTSSGGVSGPCCASTVMPEITVYGDGRVVFVEGRVGAVPGMRQVALRHDAIADLLAPVSTAGLLDGESLDIGTMCCDHGYTNVVIADGDVSHEISVVGLGAEEDATDLTNRQRADRQALVDLRSGLDSLVQEVDRFDGDAPAELAVYVSPAFPDADLDIEPTRWPSTNRSPKAASTSPGRATAAGSSPPLVTRPAPSGPLAASRGRSPCGSCSRTSTAASEPPAQPSGAVRRSGSCLTEPRRGVGRQLGLQEE